MIPEGLMMPAGIETPSNPFPGLRPFEFGESHLYFGRDGQSDQLIRKLGAARFVAVVGTSGSGKSSLVRAGLLPDLVNGYMPSAGSHWRVALMRPSNDPLGNLAQALNAEGVFGSEIEENAQIQTTITEATLRRGSLGLVEAVRQNRQPSNESLLVVVDQFEELFRFARVSASEQYRYEAAAFVKLLLEAARQREHNIYIVLTMRSDFLGDCAQFWDLPEAINEGQYLIPRMTRDERAEAITGPIAVGGGQITQRLVNRLLNDTGENTDLLPILQHALMRTWERWAGDHATADPVDLHHYEAVGTMSDALSLHADEAFNELRDERSREIAEKVFKALTEKGEDNREVRRPTVLRELCAQTGASAAEVVSVVEVFRGEGRSFLTPPAGVPLDEKSLIDISHESLIRNWQRLKDWVDEESESAQIYSRLAETAVLHERGQAGLWRDPDLQLALDWKERTGPNEAWAARYHFAFPYVLSFLGASVRARDAALVEEERRRRREIRRTRVAAAVFFVLFMLSLGAVAFAFTQRNQAQAALRQVEAANKLANNERAAAVVARDNADEQAALAQSSEQAAKEAEELALEKKDQAEESKAEALKQTEIARLNTRKAEESRLEAEKQKNSAEAESTKSRQLLYASDMNLAQQAYAATNIERGRALLDTHAPRAGVVPDFGWRYLWRLFHGASETFAVSGGSGHFALAADGRTVAFDVGQFGTDEMGLEVWDVPSRRRLRAINLGDLVFFTVALSPDGKYLAVDTNDPEKSVGSVHLLDVASGRLVTTFKTEGDTIAFSPDGGTLAFGFGIDDFERGKIELWDVASGRQKKVFQYDSSIDRLAFSPDGRGLLVLGFDHSVALLDIASDKLQYLQEATSEYIEEVAISPDGKFVAGIGGGVVRLWDAASRQEVGLYEGGDGFRSLSSVSFSPDSKQVAVGSEESSIKLFGVPSLSELGTLKGHEGDVNFMAFLPGSATLITYGGDDNVVMLWDTASLLDEREPLTFSPRVNRVAFSPDGGALVMGGFGGAALLDVEARRKLSTPQLEFGGVVESVAFSRDGTRLAIGGRDAPLTVWDAATYKKLASLTGPDVHVAGLALSPDGKRLAVTYELFQQPVVGLWDVDTQKLVKSYEPKEQPSDAIAFSPDGERIAVGFFNGEVKVLDKTLTRELYTLGKPKTLEKDTTGEEGSTVISVAFSPNGRLIAASFLKDGGIKVWDGNSGREVATLRGHMGMVFTIAFTPDGRTLASGGNDTTIKLWDTSSFKELFTVSGHSKAVLSLAFSPDGRVLASAGEDFTVRLWRAATDEEVEARRRATQSRAPR